MTRCTYSSGFSTAQNTCGSQFFISNKVAASYCVVWFPHRQIFSLSDRLLFWEMEKRRGLQDRENTEVAARVGFRVWLRNVAQVETSWCVVAVDLPIP